MVPNLMAWVFCEKLLKFVVTNKDFNGKISVSMFEVERGRSLWKYVKWKVVQAVLHVKQYVQ